MSYLFSIFEIFKSSFVEPVTLSRMILVKCGRFAFDWERVLFWESKRERRVHRTRLERAWGELEVRNRGPERFNLTFISTNGALRLRGNECADLNIHLQCVNSSQFLR